jgi:predicted  nucleic acid-binding Zn-ribbon protein
MAVMVHLHKTYDETFCGQDASHIPMTYAAEETTCDKCKAELEKMRKALEAELDEHSGNHEALEAQQSEIAKKIEAIRVLREKDDVEYRQKMQISYDEQQKLIGDYQDISTTVGISTSKKAELKNALDGLPA